MKFALIGAGSIGKRHLGNLIAAGVAPTDIVIVDPRADRVEECKAKYGISRFFESVEQLPFSEVEAAFVCSPTAYHLQQALVLASEGLHLLIEKPLAHNLDGIDELQKIIAEKGNRVLIAYPFRFSEHGRKLKEVVDTQIVGRPLYVHGEFSEYLPDWHPWEDYRSFYMAKKAQGGGSLLDQSHIMDMAHWCLGTVREAFGFNGLVSDLEVETDDLAEIQVKFESGVIGTIHQDMFGRKHSKYMEVKCTHGSIYWDVYDLSVGVFDAVSNNSTKFQFGSDHQVMYLNEINHFLELCRGITTESQCTLEDGMHGMKIIDAVLRSQLSGCCEMVG